MGLLDPIGLRPTVPSCRGNRAALKRYLYLSICLSIFLSIYQSVYLSINHLSPSWQCPIVNQHPGCLATYMDRVGFLSRHCRLLASEHILPSCLPFFIVIYVYLFIFFNFSVRFSLLYNIHTFQILGSGLFFLKKDYKICSIFFFSLFSYQQICAAWFFNPSPLDPPKKQFGEIL